MSLTPSNLFDRKSEYEKGRYELIDSCVSSWRKRQIILGADPDILSDSELLTHRRENKLRKTFKYLFVLGVPLSFWYYRRQFWTTLFLGLLSYEIHRQIINSFRFTKCNYSMEYAFNLRLSSLKLYSSYNGSYPATPDLFWKQKPIFNQRDYHTRLADPRSLRPSISDNNVPI
jgi:hypothetical protein